MTDSDRPSSIQPPTFGEELRQEREIRQISLKEIADATKISKRFLEAIEKNDYKNLPAPVFTRGFIREYARYVGLNAEDMLSRYMHFVTTQDDGETVKPLTSRHPPTTQAIPPAYRRIDRNVIIFFVLLAAVIGAGVWVRNQSARSRSTHAASPAPRTVAPRAGPPMTVPAPSTSGTGVGPMSLTISIAEESWVTLDVDGRTVINEVMSKGQQETFTGERFHFKTIGNAAGLAIVLDGVSLPALGENGEVIRDQMLDREYLRSVRESQL